MRPILEVGGLEPRDFGKALRLGLAYAALLAGLYVLKPARNALFLSRIGAAQLPIVMCAVAFVGGLTALALASAAGAFRVERLLRWLLPVLAGSLLCWWYWLSHAPALWQVAGFYVWVNLCGQLTTALLWLLVGAAVDIRQSRRIFAFVGALGIAGAVCGGALTRNLAPLFGTVNLLPLSAVALLAAAFSISGVSSLEIGTARRSGPSEDRFGDVRDSPLLRVLLLMTLLGAVATSVIDFQFNAMVDATLPNEDAKTAFFGSFFAYLNAGAFVFQLAFTSRVMNRFGLGPSLLVLPAALGIGGVFGVIAPGLAAATFLKASDASLRHSLYRSALELLFVPLPVRVKRWFRVFLDATVDNVGTGVGALIVLALTASVGVSHHHLAFLSIGVIALWAGVAMGARSAHVEAFRGALETGQIHPDELVLDAADRNVQRTLHRALEAQNDRQLAYVLELVRAVPSPAFAPRLTELASHSTPEVRAGALAALGRLPRHALDFDARPWLLDRDGRVRREAAALLARADRTRGAAVLRALLDDADPRIQVAALGAAIDAKLVDLVDLDGASALLTLGGEDGQWARRELARALSFLGASAERHRLLALLARDPAPDVMREAIRSAGRLMEPELVDFLIDRTSDRAARAYAIEALANYGPAIVPRIQPWLSVARSGAVQASMTRVLARIDHQVAVDALLTAFAGSSGGVRHAILKALNKHRARGTRLSFDRNIVEAELAHEIAQSHVISLALSSFGGSRSQAGRLLVRALEEKRKESLEHVFRLLGLRYNPKDIEVAFLAGTSNHPRARAQALEFLDNYLSVDDRRRVVSLVENGILESAPNAERRGRALADLIRCRDAWLRACAIYSAAGQPEHVAAIREALHDPATIVRETAELVLSREDAAC